MAIARAVVGERRLLLADEPSGALDSVNGEAVMRLMRDACKTAAWPRVVVTHDAQLASWADRVVFLRDGRVIDQTAPAPGPESLLDAGRGRSERRGRRTPRARPAPGNGGRPRAARGHPLGLAAVPPRVAPAAAGPGADHRRGRSHRRRVGGGHQHAAPGRRGLRHRTRHGHVPGRRPKVTAEIAALAHRFGAVDVIENQTVAMPGSITTYSLRAQNPNGAFGQPMLSLVSGHYPHGPARSP